MVFVFFFSPFTKEYVFFFTAKKNQKARDPKNSLVQSDTYFFSWFASLLTFSPLYFLSVIVAK